MGGSSPIGQPSPILSPESAKKLWDGAGKIPGGKKAVEIFFKHILKIDTTTFTSAKPLSKKGQEAIHSAQTSATSRPQTTPTARPPPGSPNATSTDVQSLGCPSELLKTFKDYSQALREMKSIVSVSPENLIKGKTKGELQEMKNRCDGWSAALGKYEELKPHSKSIPGLATEGFHQSWKNGLDKLTKALEKEIAKLSQTPTPSPTASTKYVDYKGIDAALHQLEIIGKDIPSLTHIETASQTSLEGLKTKAESYKKVLTELQSKAGYESLSDTQKSRLLDIDKVLKFIDTRLSSLQR